MPVRDALNRVRKYDSKLDPDIIGKQYADLKKSMTEQIAAYFAKIYEVEVKTKAVLSQYDVPVTLFPFYLCYARELYRLQDNYAGLPLFREIRILEKKWQDRELEGEILRRIRVDLFGITLPEEL